jgi:hypothetical protein
MDQLCVSSALDSHIARLRVYCNVLFRFSVEHILDVIVLVHSQANEGSTGSLFYQSAALPVATIMTAWC